MHKRICTDRKGWQRPRPGGPIPTVKGEFEGDQYAGSFKDHKRHGVGTYTHADGGKYVGEYKDGKRGEGTKYDKEGNVTFTYSEGVGKCVN